MTTPSRTLPLMVVAAVVAGIIPSLFMLFLAHGLHIAKVDDRPYVVSSTIDADRRTLAILHEHGFAYALTVSGDEIIATMHGQAPDQVCLVLQRPDDVTADKRYTWEKTTEPLHLRPGRSSPWHVRLEGTVNGVVARLGETAVDIGN